MTRSACAWSENVQNSRILPSSNAKIQPIGLAVAAVPSLDRVENKLAIRIAHGDCRLSSSGER